MHLRPAVLTLSAAVAVSAALAPSALSAVAPASGSWVTTSVQRGYKLNFTVRAGTVRGFKGNVLEQCAGESTSSTTAVAVSRAMRVRSGAFSVVERESSGGVTVITTVKGRFSGARRATGTVRSESIVAGSRCDTGTLRWSAKPGR
jgi:hypothetical protein